MIGKCRWDCVFRLCHDDASAACRALMIIMRARD